MAKPVEIHFSACPHDCPSTCALEVEKLDARTIGRIRGAAANSYTAGVICAKVARYAERVHSEGRLTQPMRRSGAKGTGQFEPISWDEALDRTAEAFTDAERAGGAESVWPYYYAGTMGFVQRDGINRLRNVKRYSGQHSTICTTLAQSGWLAGTGALMGSDPREITESDLVVIWGTNVVHTQVNVMTHVTRARKERDAKIVVIDPYRNATAEIADIHLALRPGTDGALACAVMHVLFEEGYADREYLAAYTDHPDEFERHLKTRTPEWAAAITGLEPQEVIDFARLYGRTKRSFVRAGYGFARSRNGAVNMHAVSCLPAVTGAWKYRGGGGFFSNHTIYHWDKTLIEGLDAIDPSIRWLDQSRIGPVLTGDPRDLGKGPPITAMLVQNTNPAVVAPESLLVRQGLAREDLFLCVHEQFMTDTARYADILLPATSFLEHDDIYQQGGSSHIIFGPKIIEPLAECRSNHEVICGLAERLGADHPGFRMSERELIDALLKASGWPDLETFELDHWHDCQPDFETAHFLKGFATPDKKFRFAPDWSSLPFPRWGPQNGALPRFPDHWEVIDAADDERPFRLVTAPARNYLNTSFTETRTSTNKEGRPTVMVHPEDARRLEIDEDDRVRLGNDRGSVVVHAKLFDGLQPGVLVVESVWPNSAFEESIGINVLTGADPGGPAGGAVFHDTAVWLRPA
jgi:anaerobic selenocysteine-containing dehydrogenase